MISLRKKRFLITQSSIHWIAGSEVYVLELADYLRKKGAVVCVFTHYFDSPMKDFYIEKGIEVTTDDSALLMDDFDYIWVHHQVLPESIIVELGASKRWPVFIFNHMSPFEELAIERPFIWSLEDSIASASVFNSQETMEAQKGLFKRSHRRYVIPNPAPMDYSKKIVKKKNQRIKNVLIVSNHAPIEVLTAIDLLRKSDINAVVMSENIDKPTIVSPDYLSKFDVVVSIGKTVQYCLCLGIPIYVYDHFGGPGFLSSYFDKAAKLNFSGRGFNKKTAEQIAREIKNDYDEALRFHSINRKRFADIYSIDKEIPELLSQVSRRVPKKFGQRYVKYLKVVHDKNKTDIVTLHDRIKQYNSISAKLTSLEQENASLKDALVDVLNSRKYRIVSAVAKCLSIIRGDKKNG